MIPFSFDAAISELFGIDIVDGQAVCDGLVGLDEQVCKQLQAFPLLESSVILRLLSAVRTIPGLALRLKSQSTAERLAIYPIGKTVLSLPPGTLENVERKEASQLRKAILSSQAKWPDLDRQRAVVLLAIDSFTGGLALPLYQSDDRLSLDALTLITAQILRSIAPDVARSEIIFGRVAEIASILFELFENTHLHARRSFDGSHLPWSTRGVFARHFTLDEVRAVLGRRKPEASSPIERYCHNVLTEKKVKQRALPAVRGFIELSVFDSGPGLASTWLTQAISSISVADELIATLDCFGARKSTSPDNTRGYGLVRVLRAVKSSRAFLSVRSNRLHLFRDFELNPDLATTESTEVGTQPDPVLFDWQLYPAQRKAVPLVEMTGTLVSVVLPVRTT